MKKSTPKAAKGLEGFLYTVLGDRLVFLCNNCCKAWSARVPASGKVGDIDKLTRYNLDLHTRAHLGTAKTRRQSEFEKRQRRLKLKRRKVKAKRRPASKRRVEQSAPEQMAS